MAAKYVDLPPLAALTGMYAFLYKAGVLVNTGGDALSLVSGTFSWFTFDLAETFTGNAEVHVHDSSTPTVANLRWSGGVAAGSDICSETFPPVESLLSKTIKGSISIERAMDLLVAAAAGEASAAGAEETFKHLDGTNAFTTEFDTDNNRIDVTIH